VDFDTANGDVWSCPTCKKIMSLEIGENVRKSLDLWSQGNATETSLGEGFSAGDLAFLDPLISKGAKRTMENMLAKYAWPEYHDTEEVTFVSEM
jgi:hypothetical protein